jgi:hypothetical protein
MDSTSVIQEQRIADKSSLHVDSMMVSALPENPLAEIEMNGGIRWLIRIH